MSQRRWAIHIIRDILKRMAELEGLGRSQIRFITDMNFYQTEMYLGFLADRGFIAELELGSPVNGGPLYQITPQGGDLLDRIRELIDFMGIDEVGDLPGNGSKPSSQRREVVAAAGG